MLRLEPTLDVAGELAAFRSGVGRGGRGRPLRRGWRRNDASSHNASTAFGTKTVLRGYGLSTAWTSARQGSAALAAELSAFGYLGAATWALQEARTSSRILVSIGSTVGTDHRSQCLLSCRAMVRHVHLATSLKVKML